MVEEEMAVKRVEIMADETGKRTMEAEMPVEKTTAKSTDGSFSSGLSSAHYNSGLLYFYNHVISKFYSILFRLYIKFS